MRQEIGHCHEELVDVDRLDEVGLEAGDPARAEAFFGRWTGWTPELHEPLAARLREAEGPRYRLVRYAALGE